MSLIDSKAQIFGKIASARTITEGLPKFKLTSSMPSVNNSGDPIAFLTDLIKALIGYEALIDTVVDLLTKSIPRIEQDVKNVLKVELKSIVSCGVDPSLPSWMKSTGTGITIEVNKIDFMDILRTSPTSVGGNLIYNDTGNGLFNSSDLNTFLYAVIQDDGNSHSWKNIVDITFNSIGVNGNPNNTITIKAHPTYDTKTLTDLNNNFVNSLTLFNTTNVLNRVMDIIFCSITTAIAKTIKQIENEEKIAMTIDKMVNNINKNPLEDSAFAFTNADINVQQTNAINRKNGVSQISTSVQVTSSVPTNLLTNFTADFNASTNPTQQRNAISNHLNIMAGASVSNVINPSDVSPAQLNFIQQIISNLVKAIVNMILSPKVALVFILNYKIVYGPTATFTDAIDFIKKNKNLMNNIMKTIAEELIKILLGVALKEIAVLVEQAIATKEKEKATLNLTQLETLIGIPTSIIDNLLNSLI